MAMQTLQRCDITRSLLIVFLAALAAFVIWQGAGILFVLFGGMILAEAASGLATWLAEKSRFSYRLAVVAVFFLLFVLLTALFYFGGSTLVLQLDEIWALVREQGQRLVSMVLSYVDETSLERSDFELSRYLPDADALWSSARQAIGMTLGVLGNMLVLIFIGAFIAWNPKAYRRGLVSLAPNEWRPRFDAALIEAAHNLRHWVAGQTVTMTVVFAFTWLALCFIGMPFAFALAFQVGLLAFIPTIGPLLAGIPILLVGTSQSMTLMLLGLGVYIIIQSLESNLLMPLVQRQTTRLLPAMTLGFQLLLGALFGFGGLIVAVPIMAVIQVLILRLYVDGILGGMHRPLLSSPEQGR